MLMAAFPSPFLPLSIQQMSFPFDPRFRYENSCIVTEQ